MSRFISCDWGTSRLRLRLVERSTCRILADHASDEGIQRCAALHPDAERRRVHLGAALERGIAALVADDGADLPVVISGMASSNLGWRALPYAELPAPIDGSTLRSLDFRHAGRQVRLISGLRDASDIMRGEETELIGLFAQPARHSLAENAVAVLPGSHSKHVRLLGGRIVEFSTFLTGELFGLLAQQSTLAAPPSPSFDREAFVAGVQASQSGGLSAALFQTRARTVLGVLAAEHGRTFLSGALIGAEVLALRAAPACPVVLAAGDRFAREYALALAELLPEVPVVALPPAEVATAAVRGHARLLERPGPDSSPRG
ncbi:MAG: 2-dehydro-3-deoxygalactonokinase [Verrucomicrobia bacterium]|nr:2-dehydro-3-deoxygalactonokinase [Verrucomicrobiota bacterium]